MNTPPLSSSVSDRRAFTLVEILISMTIFGLVMAGALGMFMQALNTYSYDAAKVMVNRDIRTFTSQLTDNATYSNYFLIFPTFANRTTTAADGSTVDTSVNDGSSGDFLVLVFKDPADDTKVNQLIGYYRDPDPVTGEGPVRTFNIKFTSSNAAIWTLLPATTTQSTNSTVIELSRDFASQKLFYNLYDRSVMVKGQIMHSGGTQKTRYERATNTYNFTVSPRG